MSISSISETSGSPIKKMIRTSCPLYSAVHSKIPTARSIRSFAFWIPCGIATPLSKTIDPFSSRSISRSLNPASIFPSSRSMSIISSRASGYERPFSKKNTFVSSRRLLRIYWLSSRTGISIRSQYRAFSSLCLSSCSSKISRIRIIGLGHAKGKSTVVKITSNALSVSGSAIVSDIVVICAWLSKNLFNCTLMRRAVTRPVPHMIAIRNGFFLMSLFSSMNTPKYVARCPRSSSVTVRCSSLSMTLAATPDISYARGYLFLSSASIALG